MDNIIYYSHTNQSYCLNNNVSISYGTYGTIYYQVSSTSNSTSNSIVASTLPVYFGNNIYFTCCIDEDKDIYGKFGEKLIVDKENRHLINIS